jgi:1A family penicillin-binding protein
MAFVNPTLTRPARQTPPSKVKEFILKLLRPLKNPRILMTVILGGMGFLLVVSGITYAVFAESLASPEALINRKNSGLIFYDKEGKEFYRTADARDTSIIKLGQIADIAEQATISIEDREFYDHGGFSPQSIGRAIITNLRLGDATAYGGSTITQQLVKNALLTQQKSYVRKFQELVLSIEIDRRYSKEQILELYLTSTYYGSGAYGISEAAETYFGKLAEELTIAEAAMLAGLPQAPSAYSPIDGDPEKGTQRQMMVLRALRDQGYITPDQFAKASEEKLVFTGATQRQASTQAPHFVAYLREQLAQKYGEDTITRSGFKIYTTLDAQLQSSAQTTVSKRIAALKGTGANNGALVALDPNTGHVLAMVGSADYSNNDINGKYNVATAMRQPGSATKPFVYLTAFGEGYHPASILQDKPTDFGGGYKPRNADGKFRGDVTVRRALANSLNIPAVAMLEQVGAPNFTDTLRSAGDADFTQDAANRCGLAIVLGCAETQLINLTHAYATLADEGMYHDLQGYTKIIDKHGNQVFPQRSFGLFEESASSRQVLDKGQVFLLSDIMADNGARSEVFGANSPLRLSRPASVKTGTTDESKDAWAFGYTPQIAVGVWVGNTTPTAMSIAGATGAAPIWRDVMEAYVRGKPVETFQPPSNVVKLSVCRGSEALSEQAGPNTFSEYFVKEHLPRQRCNAEPSPTPTPEASVSATPKPTATPTPTPLPTQSSPSATPGGGLGGGDPVVPTIIKPGRGGLNEPPPTEPDAEGG